MPGLILDAVSPVGSDGFQLRQELFVRPYSTEYLAWAQRTRRWVGLEVFDYGAEAARENAIAAYVEHINYLPSYRDETQIDIIAPGSRLIRRMYDAVVVVGPHGTHQLALVWEPVGISLSHCRELWFDRRLPDQMCISVLRDMLSCLEYLNHEAGIVHTEICEENLHVRLDDTRALDRYHHQEPSAPDVHFTDVDRKLYEEVSTRPPNSIFVLCNFTDSRFGREVYNDRTNRNLCRAPELLLGERWSDMVSVWSFGVLTWNLFESHQIFTEHHDGEVRTVEHELAEIYAICGRPPIEFIEQYPNSRQYLDADGNWIGSVPIPEFSLDEVEDRFDGFEREAFLAFMREMLCWLPEDRMTIWMLQGHPFARYVLGAQQRPNYDHE